MVWMAWKQDFDDDVNWLLREYFLPRISYQVYQSSISVSHNDYIFPLK